MNLLLATIIKHTGRYGMKLKTAKCEYLRVTVKKRRNGVEIKFPDKKPMDRVGKTTYLGGNLYDNGSSKGCHCLQKAKTFLVIGQLDQVEITSVRIIGGIRNVLRLRKSSSTSRQNVCES